MMGKAKHYEILEDGKRLNQDGLYICGNGRHFGSLAAARSFIARQLRPPSKSGRGWRIWWIREGRKHTIIHNPSGRIFAGSPQ